MTWTSYRASFTMHVMTALFFVAVENSANGEDPYRSTDLGYAIFSGQRALVAHLRDDNRMVPANAARCINCHGHMDNAASFAPPLTRRHLLSDAERRGGPPSHYTLISFCRVLRAGVDPTGIVLKKAMPQYTLSDTECAALWSFVIDS